MIYAFEIFELDTTLFQLRADGQVYAIEPKAFDFLRCLLENRDHLVTKDELIAAVWSGRIISDATLGSCVNAARKAVGDNGKDQRLIQTLPRRGFRFVGTVQIKDTTPACSGEEPTQGNPEPKNSPDTQSIQTSKSDHQSSDRPSIAVLPFENLSNEPDQDYFVDGLTEDITTALSRYHWFFVMARNSSFSFKGTTIDIRQVAEALNVQYVTEGSVRKSADRVRVNVQLIEAVSGRQLWADRFDERLEDVFQLQDNVAQRIAATVARTVEKSEIRRVSTSPPSQLAAWEFCLRGNALIYEMRKNSILEARQMFLEAIQIDPEYSRAYSGLAITHSLGLRFFSEEDRDAGTSALYEAAKRAVELDETDPKARIVMALAYMYATPAQPDYAIAEAEEAVALNPDDPQANSVLGVALALSATRFEEGIARIANAVTINPRDPINHLYLSQLSLAYLCAGRFDEAAKTAEDAIRRKPGFIESHVALASALGHLGRLEEARLAIAHFRELAEKFTIEHLVFADEVKAQILTGLQNVIAPDSPGMAE